MVNPLVSRLVRLAIACVILTGVPDSALLPDKLLGADREAPAAVLPGVNADPHIAAFGDKFYIYPTTDGTVGWMSTSFHTWSSRDLVHWTDEGVILDLPRDLAWAKVRAWAPAIATKNGKYFICQTNGTR
jgi:beta-xylosidase